MPDTSYAFYEPESGMIMAHHAVVFIAQLFERGGGVIERGHVSTNNNEQLMFNGKPLEADIIVVCTGAWMGDMYPCTVKPIGFAQALTCYTPLHMIVMQK